MLRKNIVEFIIFKPDSFMKLLPIFTFCIINLFLVQNILAVHPASDIKASPSSEIIKTTDNEKLSKKQLKKQKRQAKRLEKWEAIAKKKLQAYDIDIDLEDPVRKWLWFGLFGIAIAVSLSLIAFILNSSLFYRLSYVTGVAGVACLIIWFIKHNN